MCESKWGPAQEQQEFESDEVWVSLLVDVDDDDDDTAHPWGIFPKSIYSPVAGQTVQTRGTEQYRDNKLLLHATTIAPR